MYLGTQEIESQEGNVLTFKNGAKVEITEKNRELLTESPITGSELQEAMAKAVVKDIIDVYAAHDVRLIDINYIHQVVQQTIEGKNEEKIADLMGREKLDSVASLFGATEKATSNSVRNIRFKDIFST